MKYLLATFRELTKFPYLSYSALLKRTLFRVQMYTFLGDNHSRTRKILTNMNN